MASEEYSRPRSLGGTRRAVVEKQIEKLKAEVRAEDRAMDIKLRQMVGAKF